MIISTKPLSLAEVQELLKETEDKKPVHEYLKKYTKISASEGKKLQEELKELKNVKIKEEYFIKIIDFLPRDAEEVHKIFHDVSLDEGEVNAILDIVKKY
jgi:DNA-directed RNA polymerase subunit F